MRKILILAGRYLPGYKDGGPVRTLKNLTDILGTEYDIRIMCIDRDHGDKNPYPNIKVNTYNKVGNAKVYYVKDGKFKTKSILNEIKKVDVVYCCGPYDNYAIKTMFLKKIGLFNQNLVVASMGSFSKGALSLKSNKKKLFLFFMKKLGFFKKIIWSVTSNVEERELKEVMGNQAKCIIAEDLPRNKKVKHIHKKKQNHLKLIFISRICKMKNLLGAIQIISNLTEFPIQFDIYGNIEDKEYWGLCKIELEKLPINVKWQYRGECDSNNVVETFANYDIFLFPTLGENFGHVISESLLAGCLPIISNKTSWLDLDDYKCGNVIDLNNRELYVETLKMYGILNDEKFNNYVINAQKYISNKNKESINNTGYKEIFEL